MMIYELLVTTIYKNSCQKNINLYKEMIHVINSLMPCHFFLRAMSSISSVIYECGDDMCTIH